MSAPQGLPDYPVPAQSERLREYRALFQVPQGLLRMARALPRSVDRPALPLPRILLCPGYCTGPSIMFSLAAVCRAAGFDTRDWGLGINTGAMQRGIRGLRRNVRRHHEESGRPVILLGWSLGGYFAREVARDCPECVEQVITLGTPVVGGPKFTTVGFWLKWRGHDVDAVAEQTLRRYRVPLQVPVTAFFSKRDGIVRWEATQDHWSRQVRQVEIDCAHMAMPFAVEVLEQISELLAQRAGEASGQECPA